MAQLGIDFLRRTSRLRHRLPQQLAVALAESLDRFPDRLDAQAELGSGRRVGRTFFVARAINAKRGKPRRLPTCNLLGLQFLMHLIEQGHRPPTLEELFRVEIAARATLELCLRDGGFQWHKPAKPSTFHRLGPVPLIGQEMLFVSGCPEWKPRPTIRATLYGFSCRRP